MTKENIMREIMELTKLNYYYYYYITLNRRSYNIMHVVCLLNCTLAHTPHSCMLNTTIRIYKYTRRWFQSEFPITRIDFALTYTYSFWFFFFVCVCGHVTFYNRYNASIFDFSKFFLAGEINLVSIQISKHFQNILNKKTFKEKLSFLCQICFRQNRFCYFDVIKIYKYCRQVHKIFTKYLYWDSVYLVKNIINNIQYITRLKCFDFFFLYTYGQLTFFSLFINVDKINYARFNKSTVQSTA